jgi:hypothetical protein
MTKRDQGYMRRLRDHQPDARRGSHREEHESRKAVLYFSVAGMMALIVTLWVLVVPVQLAGLKLGGMKSAIANPAPEKSATEQWDDLITGASARLQQASDTISAHEKLTADLTAKLQAASATSSAPASR